MPLFVMQKILKYMYNTSQMGNTMDVYNHVTDQERIVREIAKLDEVRVM